MDLFSLEGSHYISPQSVPTAQAGADSGKWSRRSRLQNPPLNRRELKNGRHFWLWLLLLAPILTLSASAQTDELIPEIDLHYKIASDVRLSFQAKQTREGGEPTAAEIGPSFELYMKPWIKLKKITALDLDDSKSRPLVLSIGYRYLPAPDSPPKNRLEPLIDSHFPLKAGFLLSDRNRADLDWKSGKFSWEYRNLVQVERRVTIHSYHPAPYFRAEVFYQSQYGKWSETALYAGCLFPISKRVQFNPYYEHQNNTGKRPNELLNQLGLMLDIQF